MNNMETQLRLQNKILTARVTELEAELEQMKLHQSQIINKIAQVSADRELTQSNFREYQQKNKSITDGLYDIISDKQKQNSILLSKLKAALKNKEDYERIAENKNKQVAHLMRQLKLKQDFITENLQQAMQNNNIVQRVNSVANNQKKSQYS